MLDLETTVWTSFCEIPIHFIPHSTQQNPETQKNVNQKSENPKSNRNRKQSHKPDRNFKSKQIEISAQNLRSQPLIKQNQI